MARGGDGKWCLGRSPKVQDIPAKRILPHPSVAVDSVKYPCRLKCCLWPAVSDIAIDGISEPVDMGKAFFWEQNQLSSANLQLSLS